MKIFNFYISVILGIIFGWILTKTLYPIGIADLVLDGIIIFVSVGVLTSVLISKDENIPSLLVPGTDENLDISFTRRWSGLIAGTIFSIIFTLNLLLSSFKQGYDIITLTGGFIIVLCVLILCGMILGGIGGLIGSYIRDLL